uniref:disintegrin and metalloproteinase domain-containing protein 10-like n=1 Tax=Myxine glutinosa TaxID=7769 RepID=UPI00358F2F8E
MDNQAEIEARLQRVRRLQTADLREEEWSGREWSILVFDKRIVEYLFGYPHFGRVALRWCVLMSFLGWHHVQVPPRALDHCINTTNTDPSNPFRFASVGIEKMLDLHSESNFQEFCLAYIFTNRTFADGTLGLAWIGEPGNLVGVCAPHRSSGDGRWRSFNTGVVTVQHYGAVLPTAITHVTLAHEIGHNFGSKHDVASRCTPGESQHSPLGNFLMHPRATIVDKENNKKFSPCSIHNISKVLRGMKRFCFVEPQQICGNQIMEEGEQCDCGFAKQCNDTCCYSADQAERQRCHLKPNAICSPSQGLCCTPECVFAPAEEQCHRESECSESSYCSGDTTSCPKPNPKSDMTLCKSGTQVCINGVCAASVCKKHGLEECFCESKDMEKHCHLCCMNPGDPRSCSSTDDSRWKTAFHHTLLRLNPGSSCGNYRGYCDSFQRCRIVNPEGTFSRLKNAIFRPTKFKSMSEWVRARWWILALLLLGLVLIMSVLMYFCSVYTPTSNPNKTRQRKFFIVVTRTYRGRTDRQPRNIMPPATSSAVKDT